MLTISIILTLSALVVDLADDNHCLNWLTTKHWLLEKNRAKTSRPTRKLVYVCGFFCLHLLLLLFCLIAISVYYSTASIVLYDFCQYNFKSRSVHCSRPKQLSTYVVLVCGFYFILIVATLSYCYLSTARALISFDLALSFSRCF